MGKDGFAPIRAEQLVQLAGQPNAGDLGPAVPIEELLLRPERPYLVQGVLTQGSLALLSAESFVGKTFFGMELARAVSTGSRFMGRYPVRRGGVLYIAQDGSDEEYLRQWKKLAKSHWDQYRLEEPAVIGAWTRFFNGAETEQDLPLLSKLPGNPFGSRIRFEFNRALGIDNQSDLLRIGLTALRMEHSHREVWVRDEAGRPESIDPDATEKGVKLIVFDAGHSVFFGNENDSGEVQNVMTNLRQLANATGATVILMVHLNKHSRAQSMAGIPPVHENRVRGSGVFQSAPDWHMQLHRGKEDGEVYAFQLKDRAGNRCKSFVYQMAFEEEKGKMTLSHVRDMSSDEHRDRRVRSSLAVAPGFPDAAEVVGAEFEKGGELSRDDVARILRGMPQYHNRAQSTLESKAKDLLRLFEGDGSIEPTQAPAPGRPARYRKKRNLGKAAGGV
jgi:hypothetical protein